MKDHPRAHLQEHLPEQLEKSAKRLRLTKHGRQRMRQRGFSRFSLDILVQFGRHEHAQGGAMKIFFGNKEYKEAIQEFKRVIQALDKVKGGTMIISQSDVLTMYKK